MGKIDAEQYAQKVAATEASGTINQILVASELKLTKIEGAREAMNALLEQYSSGDISKKELTTIITANQSNLIIQETGQNALEYYNEQGQNIRDIQLMREKRRK